VIDATGVHATPKAPEIDAFVEQVCGGGNRVESVSKNVCVSCTGSAQEFRNEISVKEYLISGLCQKCQDSVFGKD